MTDTNTILSSLRCAFAPRGGEVPSHAVISKDQFSAIDAVLTGDRPRVAVLVTRQDAQPIAYAINESERGQQKYFEDMAKGGWDLHDLVLAPVGSSIDDAVRSAAEALDACNWFDASPCDSDELASAKALMRKALERAR